MHLNIRSLWSKIDLFKDFFSEYNADLITLSETWLTPELPDQFIELKGYCVICNDRKWSDQQASQTLKKGGGICTYIREGLNYKIDILPDLNVSSVDLECQNIELIMENQKKF